jgi:hypothetical protein
MPHRRSWQAGSTLAAALALAFLFATPSVQAAKKRRSAPRPPAPVAAVPAPAPEPLPAPAPAPAPLPAPASEPTTDDKRPNPHGSDPAGRPNPFGSKVASGLPNPYQGAPDGRSSYWGFASVGPLAAYMNREGESWEGGGELSIWVGRAGSSRSVLGRTLLGADLGLTTTRFYSEVQACYFPVGVSAGVVHNYEGFSATGFQGTFWMSSLFIVPFFQMNAFADRWVVGGGVSLKVPFFVSRNAPAIGQ